MDIEKKLKATVREKTNNLFKGFLIAIVVFALITLALYLLQAEFAPINNLSKYLVDTNANQDELLNLSTKKAIYFQYRIPKEWNEMALLFPKTNLKGTQVFLNGSKIFDNVEESRVSIFKSEENILDLRNPALKFPLELKIEIEKGGHLQLLNGPLVGEFDYLSVFSKINTIFSDYIMLLLSGIAFLLAFIMFSVSFTDKEKLRSFLPIALASSYYSFFFFINVVCFNDPGYLFREGFLSLGNVHFSLNPMTPFGILSALAMFSMVALFSGVEKFIFNSWRVTRILFFINAVFYCFIFINPLMVFYGNFFIIILFFAVLTYRSNNMFFNFLTIFQFLVGIHGFIAQQIYPLWTFHIYTLGSAITLTGYGFFFILNVNKLIYSKKHYERLASHDELTGVTTRRTFTKNLNQLIERGTYPWTLVFIDVDRLKEINDVYSHAKGDEVLHEIGETLKEFTRKNDLVARLGGDEFVLVLVGDEAEDTDKVMERIQAHLAQKRKELGLELPFSISYGMSTVTPSNQLSVKEIIHQADQRMYEQKKQKGTQR